MENSTWFGAGLTCLLAALGFKAKWIHSVSKKVDVNEKDILDKLNGKVNKEDFLKDKDRLLNSIDNLRESFSKDISGVHRKIDSYRDSTEDKLSDLNKTNLELVKYFKKSV
jgi:hypothetical protein